MSTQRIRCVAGVLSCVIAYGLIIACKDDEKQPSEAPAVLFAEAGLQPLNCVDAALNANGTDQGSLEIRAAGSSVNAETYQLELISADGHVVFSPQADGGASATTLSITGNQHILVPFRTGLESGNARVHVGYGGSVSEYCLGLPTSNPATIELRVRGVDATIPNWTAYVVEATIRAKDGKHVSNNTALKWTANACAYLAAETTLTSGSDTVSNLLYIPNGTTLVDLAAFTGDSSVADGSVARRVCVTVAGLAAAVGNGSCPDVSDGGQLDGGSAPTIRCP